jgi:hypothetical protein
MLGPGLGLPGSSLAEAAASLGRRVGCLAGVRSLALEVEGSAGGKGAGRCSRKWGGGGEDVGEARRSDSQDLPCWECQPRIFCSPPPALELPHRSDPPCVVICRLCGPDIQP